MGRTRRSRRWLRATRRRASLPRLRGGWSSARRGTPPGGRRRRSPRRRAGRDPGREGLTGRAASGSPTGHRPVALASGWRACHLWPIGSLRWRPRTPARQDRGRGCRMPACRPGPSRRRGSATPPDGGRRSRGCSDRATRRGAARRQGPGAPPPCSARRAARICSGAGWWDARARRQRAGPWLPRGWHQGRARHPVRARRWPGCAGGASWGILSLNEPMCALGYRSRSFPIDRGLTAPP